MKSGGKQNPFCSCPPPLIEFVTPARAITLVLALSPDVLFSGLSWIGVPCSLLHDTCQSV